MIASTAVDCASDLTHRLPSWLAYLSWLTMSPVSCVRRCAPPLPFVGTPRRSKCTSRTSLSRLDRHSKSCSLTIRSIRARLTTLYRLLRCISILFRRRIRLPQLNKLDNRHQSGMDTLLAHLTAIAERSWAAYRSSRPGPACLSSCIQLMRFYPFSRSSSSPVAPTP